MKTRRFDFRTELAKNGIFVALIALVILFSIVNPRFLSPQNGLNILLQVAELGLIVIPMAFLLITGVVDLSVGSIASVAAVTAGITMVNTGSVILGFLAGFAFGVFAGAINGFLVAVLRLNPIVITLGFLSVWGGLAMLLTDGRTITRSDLPEAFRSIGSFMVGPIPLRLVIILLVAAIAWYVLARHRVGRTVYAIGGNERAAHLMGLNVVGTRFALYVVSGVFAALAGIMLSAKVQSVSPAIGLGMEMQALTVVLLGGVAFAGGYGRMGGVLAGLLFFSVLRSGLIFLQASAFLQTVIVGLTLVIAVSLDESIQRILKRAWAKRGRLALTELDSGKNSMTQTLAVGDAYAAEAERKANRDD